MITIAIDGFSACGKSTLAKAMARHFEYRFIDTGAMYRAVTLFFLRNGVHLDNDQQVREYLGQLTIDFQTIGGKNCVLLNGENVEEEIRGLEVGNWVSPVATISAVRRAMVEQQRRMGKDKGIVMDGRDIGTVVFPDAELKLFVTADVDTRVDRRLNELNEAGKNVTRQAVKDNLLERDHIDSSRADSPLRKADDAILLDNSDLSFSDFIEAGINLAQEAIERQKRG